MTTQPDEIKPRWPFLATRWANTVRYSLMNIFILACTYTLAMGGYWMWFGLCSTFIIIGYVEELMGDAGDKELMPPVWYMNLMLWLTLPLLLLATLVALNAIGDGKPWLDGFVSFFGIDPDAARARTSWFTASGGLASLGMLYGLGGINVAHELVHRTDKLFDLLIGRWLLSFTWDTGFSIEHVYGHHRNVGTPLDPATAKRGEYVFAFVVRSTWGQLISAYEFEKERLARRKIPNWPWNNRFWRGQMMTVCVIALYTYMVGPWGIFLSLFAGAIGKIYLEIVNYVEHYGLVRIPGTRVEPRHSWDSYRRLSTGMTYNLPLHSFHHRYATRPFWELQHSTGQAPMMPMGYMPMILCSFWPPLWRSLIDPLLADWDSRLASPEERAYLEAQGELRA